MLWPRFTAFGENARRDDARLEAERPEQLAEKIVQLIAKSAAPVYYNLLKNVRQGEVEKPFVMNVDIFEGDLKDVAFMQRGKRAVIRLNRTIVSYSLQVFFGVQMTKMFFGDR
jgi:hypothetical protein